MRALLVSLLAALWLLGPGVATAQTGQSQTGYPVATTPYDGTEMATGTQDGVTKQLKATDIAAQAKASPTAVNITATTDAGVRAYFTTAAANPGVVYDFYMPASPITLSSALPALSNVHVHCAYPLLTTSSASIDDEAQFAGGTGQGTIFEGTGNAYDAFDGNNTALGSPGSFEGWLQGFTVEGCGFQGFAIAINIGATNNPGLANGYIRHNVFINNLSPYHLVNMVNIDVDGDLTRPEALAGSDCGEIGADVASSTYQPGNMLDWRDACSRNPVSDGFIFYASSGSIIDIVRSYGLQANVTQVSYNYSATPTLSSTAWPIPDLTKWQVGQWFIAGASVDGLKAGEHYVWTSLSGSSGSGTGTLAICRADTSHCPNIAATATTAVTLTNAGFPGLDIYGGGSFLSNEFLAMDFEDGSAGGVSFAADNLSGTLLDSIANSGDVVMRGSGQENVLRGAWFNPPRGTYDDLSAGYNLLMGQVKTVVNTAPGGVYYDSLDGVQGLTLATGAQTQIPEVYSAYANSSHQWKANLPIMEYVQGPLCTANLTGYPGGISDIYACSSSATITLPTVATTTGYANMAGLKFWIWNSSSYPATVNTNGTQTINNISGLTSVVIQPGQQLLCYAYNASGASWLCQLPGPPSFLNNSGVALVGSHEVYFNGTLSGGAATVTFSGNAIFTSSTSYACVANDNTAPNSVEISYSSGTSIAVSGTGADTFKGYCKGS